jgi:hypothetical protein
VTAAADLGAVRGLHDFWAARTFQPGATPVPPQRARLLLDTLGLGIEQVATYLRDQPDYATFTAWIRATAGAPDGDRVARYHAWLAGAPPPAAARMLLAEIDTMPPVLDAAQLEEWAADGVIVLRHAITPVEAKAVEQVLWQKIDASPDNPASWYGRATQGIMLQCFQHPALEAARRSRRVHKAFAQLFGTADLWTTTDRMSFNPPETIGHPFPGPHLHWDTSLALPIPLSMGGILYLTDTAATQGALQVVRGFHRRIEPWLAALGDVDPRTVDLSAEATTVPANAGDLVIWRDELPHGASPNRTDRPRLAHYITMYPADQVALPDWR